ncbi:MAG: chemotaxis protein CheW [Sulfuriferula sp.]
MEMEKSDFLVIFTLADQRYAIPLRTVDKVVRMVAITLLPHAPDFILGVINFKGQVIPVINIRRRFFLPERKVAISDQLVIAHTARRPVALVVDAVLDVIASAEQDWIAPESILPNVEYVDGVIKLTDGLIFIHDLNKFLSLDEESFLDQALENA